MDEKKTYDRTYVVTISTEEYRELIDERATFKCEAEQWSDKYWEKYSEAVSLARSNSEKQAEIDRFHAFIRSSAALEDSYWNFCRDIGEAPDA
ncbi:MAG: hypothetical protein ACI3VX_00450 [Faecousia sp.]